MLTSDERHWWYRGRRRVLRATLDRLPLPAACRILDAGCGSGRTLDELASYGSVAGVDLSAAAVAAARARGHIDVRQGAVECLPHPDVSFDLITCLDVIEHTTDDVRTLRELRRVARPGSFLVVTVPAYPWLWSAHDELNRHYRRYRRPALRRAAMAAGWAPQLDTHFNSLLLAPAAAVRLLQRHRPADAARSDLELTPSALDTLLTLPMCAEAALVRRGARLPAGMSLLAVLRNMRPAPRRPAGPRRSSVPPRTRTHPDARPLSVR